MNETMNYVINGTKDLSNTGDNNVMIAVAVLSIACILLYFALLMIAYENAKKKKFIAKNRLLQQYDDWEKERKVSL
jgi:hypothetical protein